MLTFIRRHYIPAPINSQENMEVITRSYMFSICMTRGHADERSLEHRRIHQTGNGQKLSLQQSQTKKILRASSSFPMIALMLHGRTIVARAAKIVNNSHKFFSLSLPLRMSDSRQLNEAVCMTITVPSLRAATGKREKEKRTDRAKESELLALLLIFINPHPD